jgi:hypothetical protein
LRTRTFALGIGAEQITLEGVYHSPLGAGADGARPWYGSPGIIEQWIRVVYADDEFDKDFRVEVGDMIQS